MTTSIASRKHYNFLTYKNVLIRYIYGLNLKLIFPFWGSVKSNHLPFT